MRIWNGGVSSGHGGELLNRNRVEVGKHKSAAQQAVPTFVILLIILTFTRKSKTTTQDNIDKVFPSYPAVQLRSSATVTHEYVLEDHDVGRSSTEACLPTLTTPKAPGRQRPVWEKKHVRTE